MYRGCVSVIDTKTSGSLEVTFISSRITPTCSMSINKLISEFALKAVKYYDRRKEQEREGKLIVLTMS